MVTSDQNIVPIVPMGSLIDMLGCAVSWSKEAMQVQHPTRGLLPVEDDCGGCPQIPRMLALELISEIEDNKKGVSLNRMNVEEEMKRMEKLIQVHPCCPVFLTGSERSLWSNQENGNLCR